MIFILPSRLRLLELQRAIRTVQNDHLTDCVKHIKLFFIKKGERSVADLTTLAVALGTWSATVQLPIIPISAAMLPTGKVLV